jgi:hypothetical protein
VVLMLLECLASSLGTRCQAALKQTSKATTFQGIAAQQQNAAALTEHPQSFQAHGVNHWRGPYTTRLLPWPPLLVLVLLLLLPPPSLLLLLSAGSM